MSDPRITWTPDGESSSVTLDFPHGLTRLQGLRNVQRGLAVSASGVATSVVYDAWAEFLVELRAVSRESDPTAFAKLTAWWSHAARGGEFAFAVDSSKMSSTTLSAAASQGDTTVSVASTTGFSAGDWVVFEDDDDPTKWERHRISSVGTGTLTIGAGLAWSYASGSPVRHAEYWPKCVCLETKSPLVEREAGRGAHLWDLRFRFRQVR